MEIETKRIHWTADCSSPALRAGVDCPELDIASQGASIEESRVNLIEALTLFFETASPSEIARRAHNEVFITQVEVPVG